jgi:hypothetical protein
MSGKDRNKKAIHKLLAESERNNAKLIELQSTYSLTLSAFLLEMHEQMTQREAQPGEEIKYFIPVELLQRISESHIKIDSMNDEGKIGAAISLILAPPPPIEGNGQKETTSDERI